MYYSHKTHSANDTIDLSLLILYYAKMYHNVGNQGLYFRLRDAGILDSKLLGHKIVRSAVCHPPRGTRAFARSSAIREVANEAGTVANWTEVRNKNRRSTFLDPLLTTYVWQLLKGPELKK